MIGCVGDVSESSLVCILGGCGRSILRVSREGLLKGVLRVC